MYSNMCKRRANLDYDEEVYWLVKNLAQDKVIWGNSWYGGQDGEIFKIEKYMKLDVSKGQVSYLRVQGCPRNLTSKELP